MNDAIRLPLAAAPSARTVNWPRVDLFVGLTFGLTWLLNLGLLMTGGLASPAALMMGITQMLIPAFSAIVLETFFFSDSPLYFKVHRGPARWFTYYYMTASALEIAITVTGLVFPGMIPSLNLPFSLLVFFGLVVALVSRWRGGNDNFTSIGMGGGSWRWWVILGFGVVGFYLLLTLLNILFRLGPPVDIAKIFPEQGAAVGLLLSTQGSLLLNVLLLTPLLNIVYFFGEEYGWRGFLQTALTGMGRVKGVFLVGLIWGLWHAPVVLMGASYPENPVLGVLLKIVFCILAAYYLAYSVYKSHGIWTAAYLHGVNNNIVGYFFGILYTPTSLIQSFSLGVYGLVVMALLILWLLRDPLWKQG